MHQLGDAIGDLLDAKARLPRLERQAVAGQRWRDDREGVRGIAAKPRGIREPRDQLQKLEDRARPAVQQQQRTGGRPFAGHMQEMQIDTAERHLELRKGVEPRLLGAPVEGAPPGISVHQLLPAKHISISERSAPIVSAFDGQSSFSKTCL